MLGEIISLQTLPYLKLLDDVILRSFCSVCEPSKLSSIIDFKHERSTSTVFVLVDSCLLSLTVLLAAKTAGSCPGWKICKVGTEDVC